MKSIYIHTNWNKLQEKQEGGEAVDFVFTSSFGEISYSFIKRFAREYNGKKYYDIVTPRGELGHQIHVKDKGDESNLVSEFNIAFQEYCDQNAIIAEFIKYDPWNDVSHYFADFYEIKKYGKLYCIDIQKDFLNQVISNDKRYDIRKALESNLRVEFDFNGKTIKDFVNLYGYTEDKYRVSSYYHLTENFIQNYFELLGDKVFIANCYFEDVLVSSMLILLGEDIAHYHFSANNPHYKSLRGNILLLYKCMEYCKALNKKLFDLGGAIPNSSLERYKEKLIKKDNRYLYEYNVGKKIRNREIYDIFVKDTNIKNQNYFPLYRQ